MRYRYSGGLVADHRDGSYGDLFRQRHRKLTAAPGHSVRVRLEQCPLEKYPFVSVEPLKLTGNQISGAASQMVPDMRVSAR